MIKLEKKDIPYFLSAVVCVYSFSVALLYFLKWILEYTVSVQIPTLAIFLSAFVLSFILFLLDTKDKHK